MKYKINKYMFHPLNSFRLMCTGYVFSFDFALDLFSHYITDYEVQE